MCPPPCRPAHKGAGAPLWLCMQAVTMSRTRSASRAGAAHDASPPASCTPLRSGQTARWSMSLSMLTTCSSLEPLDPTGTRWVPCRASQQQVVFPSPVSHVWPLQRLADLPPLQHGWACSTHACPASLGLLCSCAFAMLCQSSQRELCIDLCAGSLCTVLPARGYGGHQACHCLGTQLHQPELLLRMTPLSLLSSLCKTAFCSTLSHLSSGACRARA